MDGKNYRQQRRMNPVTEKHQLKYMRYALPAQAEALVSRHIKKGMIIEFFSTHRD